MTNNLYILIIDGEYNIYREMVDECGDYSRWICTFYNSQDAADYIKTNN